MRILTELGDILVSLVAAPLALVGLRASRQMTAGREKNRIKFSSKPKVRITLIAAVSENNVIGRNGDLPWRLPSDLKRFKELTMGSTVLLGRKTYESIRRPLPGRRMIVITRQRDFTAEGIDVVASLREACRLAASNQINHVFVMGGAEIYPLALPLADRLEITRVHAEVEGDAKFPEWDQREWVCVRSDRHESDEKNQHPYSFEVYERLSPWQVLIRKLSGARGPLEGTTSIITTTTRSGACRSTTTGSSSSSSRSKAPKPDLVGPRS